MNSLISVQLCFFLQHLLLILTPTTSSTLSPDGLSLLAFKSAVSSDPTSALSSWDESYSSDPCHWPGISCSNFSGFSYPRVVAISVSGKNLSGYIPSELGSLLFLRRLNLHSNRLSGSIPSQLFNASSLHSIFLYNNNLTGILPSQTCNYLPRIQNIDLSRNSLSGPIPEDLRTCSQLQRLLLSENRFSGEVPSGIWPEMVSLIHLDISSNNLSGSLPTDIGDLNSLSGTLNLSHNHFTGNVPSSLGNLPAMVSLDLRYNNLSGEIPQTGSLVNQEPTAFLNNHLCGFPLLHTPCENNDNNNNNNNETPPPPPPPQVDSPEPEFSSFQSKKGLKPSLILLISVADAVGVAVIGLVLVYIYWKIKDGGDNVHSRCSSCIGKTKLGGKNGDNSRGINNCCLCWKVPTMEEDDDDEEDEEEEEEEEDDEGMMEMKGEGRLVAMDKGFKFELDELLRASAYVLGKGGRGIVYKVVVGNGVSVAVRRLGEGGGGGKRYKEFAAEVEAIGRVRHQNLVRLRAYYWAPDEKLIITDFVSNGNLASALRGRPGQPTLPWLVRLKIAKGAAHGLAHLHECSPRKFVHGDIKPSNILLDAEFTPYISDFGLIRLINIAGSDPSSSSASSYLGFIGSSLPSTKPIPIEKPNNYRAPEARMPGARPIQKWDVYSFGVVLLEMLTGKAPDTSASSPGAQVSDLVQWVRKGFEDARPLSEMVDPVLLLKEVDAMSKREVVSVFHIGLACTESDPELRPRMKQVSDNLDRVGS